MSYTAANDEYGVRMAPNANDPEPNETAHLILSPQGEVIECTNEFQDRGYIDKLTSIVTDLRMHQERRLTDDIFLGATIQYQDVYYKIDLSEENAVIRRFLMPHVVNSLA